jgi:hypothetical protein
MNEIWDGSWTSLKYVIKVVRTFNVLINARGTNKFSNCSLLIWTRTSIKHTLWISKAAVVISSVNIAAMLENLASLYTFNCYVMDVIGTVVCIIAADVNKPDKPVRWRFVTDL